MLKTIQRRQGSGNAVAWAALVVSVGSLVASASGIASAAHDAHRAPKRTTAHARTPARGAVVRLGRDGRIPARYLPTVAKAKYATTAGSAGDAKTLDGQSPSDLAPSCPPTTVDLGTWCLMSGPYPLTNQQVGLNNYSWATQQCVAMGGYLPTAAQLIGAAARVKLESTIDDSPLTATVQTDPNRGLKDQREMTATLVTTAAGSDAAGSEGVTQGSTGNPNTGEPNPQPQPANPQPQTLQYVTVYSNHQKGGFAGSEPVSQPENFRCAFEKVPGASSQNTQ